MEKEYDSNGRTALHKAAEDGDLEEATRLINSGYDVNEADKYGGTPLFTACCSGHLEVARMLIDRGGWSCKMV